MKLTRNLILASGSKSRLNLLAQINVKPHKICSADIDETRLKGEKPLDMVKRLAKAKALKVAELYPNDIVMSADTISVVGNRVLDKTYSADIEREYLALIGGRRHKLYSSVCFAIGEKSIFKQKTEMSVLKFKRFSKEEIEEIIACEQWKGCSGGYAIEGLMGKYLTFVSGSVSNIMGLPLHIVHNHLTCLKNL